MSKEYLDRKEVEEIINVFLVAQRELIEEMDGMDKDMEDLLNQEKEKIKEIIDKRCQLKPKNQVVIAEGKVKKIYYSVNFIKIDFADLPEKIALGKSLPKNKKVKIILEEI